MQRAREKSASQARIGAAMAAGYLLVALVGWSRVVLRDHTVTQAAAGIAGFIIGSISTDEELVLGNMGRLEDWFVTPGFRKQGTGVDLYNELEKWFKAKGCKQVTSGTWEGNDLSIAAHEKPGFFISEITFSKKI